MDLVAHIVSSKTMGLVLFFFVSEKWLCPSFPQLVMPEYFLTVAAGSMLDRACEKSTAQVNYGWNYPKLFGRKRERDLGSDLW